MIKLIAFDLDGTLLNDQRQVDPSFWHLYEKLHREKGVMFVAASGRQYFTIEEQFRSIRDSLIILAENGTHVRYGNRELQVEDMGLAAARSLMRKGREVQNAHLVLCGKQSAYVDSTYEPFLESVQHYYRRLQVTPDLMEVEDQVLKVTLWDELDAETNSYPHFKTFEKKFKVAVAGNVWLDITKHSANKGAALEKIQERFNISREETLVFGDYLNDWDMMSVGYYSYAMKNAHEGIRVKSRFITRYDNNNNGVVRTIAELFEEEV